MRDDWGERARILVADDLAALVVVLLVASAAGAAVTYATHVDPGTETTRQTVSSWESTAAFEHSATVVESNRVFPVGTTLENRSLYFTRLSPVLDGTFSYGFSAPDGELATEIETVLVLRAVGEEGVVYWRVTEPLERRNATLVPGESASVAFDVNVSAVLDETEAIESDLGGSPGTTEARVLARVSAEGTVADAPVGHSETYELGLVPGQDTYGVVDPGGKTERHRRTEPVTAVRSHGPLRTVGGPLLLLLPLAGLVALGYGRARGVLDVDETDRRQVAFAAERAEFDDWISRASVPSAALDRPRVRAADLEQLVDVAIDNETRVLEDVDARSYYVLAGGLCYEWELPPDVSP